MPDLPFKPVVYLKDNCPFCFKVRLFVLEAGLGDTVELISVTAGEPAEQKLKASLQPHFEKITFPAAQLKPGEYINDSDTVVRGLSAISGKNPEQMAIYRDYTDGPFKRLGELYSENVRLRRSAS